MALFGNKKEKIAKPDPKVQAAAKATSERVALEEERIYRKGVVSIRDLIAPAAMKIDQSSVQLGGVFARTVFVITYPRYIGVGWSSPVINLSYPLDISMFFYPVKAEIILKQLKKKVGILEAQILSDTEKGAPRDPIRETALRDIEGLRDNLTQGIEHFFQFAFYVTVYADSLDDLNKVTVDIESIFGSMLIYSKRVFFQAEQGFNSTLPMGNDELMITFNMNTSPIAASFPFISADLSSNDGVLFGINKHNNSLVLFDRFSLQNANSVVFATSGAGKSVSGDTEVLIRDQNDAVTRVAIGQFIDSLEQKHRFEKIDDEMEGVYQPGIEVYTFNKKLRGEWSPVSVAARKLAPGHLYTFKTKSGREITVTGDHNMLVLRNGQVVATKSEGVALGECAPVPTHLAEPSSPTTVINLLKLLATSHRVYVENFTAIIKKYYSTLSREHLDERFDRYLYKYRDGRKVPITYTLALAKKLGLNLTILAEQVQLCSVNKPDGVRLPAILDITPALAKLLGYIVSEGHVNERYVLISQKEQAVWDDIARTIKEIGIPYFNRKDGTFVIASRVWVDIIHALGVGTSSATKRAPTFLANAAQPIVAAFLQAYFEGDGGVERSAITAVTKSKGLASDLATLLLRFGIIARLRNIQKHATNTGAVGRYWLITISGQENLQRYTTQINFVSARKCAAALRLLGKPSNTNVDVIPVQDVFQKLYALVGPLLRGIQDGIEMKNGSYMPSRHKLADIIGQIQTRFAAYHRLTHAVTTFRDLPHRHTATAQWATDHALNARLWSTLGQSWRVMKNPNVSVGVRNMLLATGTVTGVHLELRELKRIIRSGFKLLGLSVRAFSPTLQSALVERPEGNTRYALLYEAADYLARVYDTVRPRVAQAELLLDRMTKLVNADLSWDPIVAIEKTATTDQYVYDLTVDNEVFLAGHGSLYVHNSYAIKLEVLRALMLGVEVIVIDPEMEYKHLSDAVGGTYVNISLSSDAKINPFDLPRPIGEEASTEDIIRSAVITIKGLIRLMLGAVKPEEDSLIDRALLETYAKKDITADLPLSSLATVEPPIMQDFQDVLEGMEGTNELVIKLKKFTEGTFAGLLNSPTTVGMQNILVVFSVRDLEDELRPMAIYTIVNYIWNVVRSERKKRILVIDEAWWLMQHEDSAKFIFALVKRCRKYYLGVTTITQDVNDFLRSPYGQAIVTNSSTQLLLKQSPASIDLVQKTFLLTDSEKFELLQTGVGQGIFFAGSNHVAIRVIASYTEDQIITSDPAQLMEIEQAKKDFDASIIAQEATQTVAPKPAPPQAPPVAPTSPNTPNVPTT